MKIFTASQIKEADNYTIQNESIQSIDLMEKASIKIANWIINHIDINNPLLFLIGKGNNGGDGLAVARILHHAGYECSFFLAYEKSLLCENTLTNLNSLPKYVEEVSSLDDIPNNMIIIDALLGTGVKRKIEDPLKTIITKVNNLSNKVISIDLPSGMISEFGNKDQLIIKADITITLEFYKLAMLLPEAGEYCGQIILLSIGLSKYYIDNTKTKYYVTTNEFIDSIKLNRDKFTHKGTFGHVLLICGSEGMMGAAYLATGGALRSGCGLVTTHVPKNERFALQNLPSAMLSLDANCCLSSVPNDLKKYSAIGIGSGIGTKEETISAFSDILMKVNNPIVIDADALNIISEHPELKKYIPENSILTPHPGELKRLIGEWEDDKDKIELVRKLAKEIKSIIIVKGAYSMICTPEGDCYFNSTGNSGMAKGGSGDVLTGYITGLIARGYESAHAALIGVYMHGLAGDRAAKRYGMEAMNSNDLINFLY